MFLFVLFSCSCFLRPFKGREHTEHTADLFEQKTFAPYGFVESTDSCFYRTVSALLQVFLFIQQHNTSSEPWQGGGVSAHKTPERRGGVATRGGVKRLRHLEEEINRISITTGATQFSPFTGLSSLVILFSILILIFQGTCWAVFIQPQQSRRQAEAEEDDLIFFFCFVFQTW